MICTTINIFNGVLITHTQVFSFMGAGKQRGRTQAKSDDIVQLLRSLLLLI